MIRKAYRKGDFKMKSAKSVIALLLFVCISLLCACGSKQCRHVVVTDFPVAATCTENGLTEGSHCADCNEILVQQTPVIALGHRYGEWLAPEQDISGQWMQSRFCAVCGYEETELLAAPAYRNDLGSAGELSGTTLLISIFADDANTRWDFSSDRDKETAALMCEYLGAGVDWIVQQCSSYGVTPRFIYEWESSPDLCYTFDFGQEKLVREDGGGYWVQQDYVRDHIPAEELKQKYNAQNIIFIFYFNTNEQNTVNSWSLSDRNGVDTEIINVFVRDDYSAGFYYMSASSFAHEIMHCFGAHDLYYPSEAIPQEYVDHCRSTNSNDIMYTVGIGVTITQELSRLDAYYLGLTDSCELVDLWGLGKSTHLDRQQTGFPES